MSTTVPLDTPRPSALSTAVFTVLGNLVLVVATLILAPIATLIGWFPPRGNGMFHTGRLWSRLWLAGCGAKLRGEGAEDLDPHRAYIFMANHQSMLDIPALFVTLPGQTRFLAKKGLFQIPLFGWSLKSGGFIPVDRGNSAAARQTFQTAIDRLSDGRSILVFPEETRSADGRLLPFKPGGFLMALKSGHPIVPVGIRGTGAVRRKGGIVNRPGPVKVRYGAPIDVAEYGVRQRTRLMSDVRDAIDALMGEETPC